MVKLTIGVRGHFVTPTEVGKDLIKCNPGHIPDNNNRRRRVVVIIIIISLCQTIEVRGRLA